MHEFTSPSDGWDAGPQVYLSQGLECDESLLELPVNSQSTAPAEGAEQLLLEGYVEEIRSLRSLPSIHPGSVKHRLSATASALANSVSIVGNPSFTAPSTCGWSSQGGRFGRRILSTILVSPLGEPMPKSGKVWVKPRGVAITDSFDIPLCIPSSSGPASTLQISDPGDGTVSLDDAKHLVSNEPATWERTVSVIAPTLESVEGSLQE
jgi:hypothetical protein